MALEIGKMLEQRYQIKEAPKWGGFSRVYKAYDSNLMAVVALKELKEDYEPELGSLDDIQKRFKNEAVITRYLKHPHIIVIHDLFTTEDLYYFVMEYMDCSLKDLLKTNPVGLKPADACKIMLQICQAIGHVHTKSRIVHCDLKPGNILWNKKSEIAKITDFGAAYVPQEFKIEGVANFSLTQAGTMHYMAPEQLDGKRDDPRIDVYALGAIFFRLLTGQYYVNFGANEKENKKLICEAPPCMEILKEMLSEAELYDEIIKKALSKEPNERYANAQEMYTAIKNKIEHSDETTQNNPQSLANSQNKIFNVYYNFKQSLLHTIIELQKYHNQNLYLKKIEFILFDFSVYILWLIFCMIFYMFIITPS